MNGSRLVLRSLAQHRRTHLGVAAGAAIATAVLVGALGVGDSLERSLTEQALRRIGAVRLAMDTGERTFTAPLADALTAALAAPGAPSAAALHVPGLASADGGRRRVPDVHVHGVGDDFWAVGGHAPVALGDGRAAVSAALARALGVGVGDEVLLRFAAPSALPRDVPLGGDAADTLTLRVTVERVLGAGELGDFDLSGNPEAPRNAFVPLATLERAAHLGGRRNVVLATSASAAVEAAAGPGTAGATDAPIVPPALRAAWRLEDAGARLRRLGDGGPWDLSSERVFLAEPLARAALAAAPARAALTYWVDAIEAPSGRVARYAMVTAYDPGAPAAAPPAPIPADLAADQIVVSRWLADQLAVDVGDALTLRYWVFGLNRQLTRASARFTVARVVPTDGAGGDRALMPELPGLTDVESALDWDPAPELDVHPELLSDAERDYWRDHRGAPKAFVSASWARGAGGWRTPYGEVTSVRIDGGLDEATLRERIRAHLEPGELGLGFQPVRDQALRAVGGGVAAYFGYLFASLSAFVIVAALVLVVLLFTFQVEARSPEIGTLRAVGIPARRIRGWLLAEGAVVAASGCALGIPAGWLYVWLMLRALAGRWAGAVAGTPVTFHVAAATPQVGAGLVLAASTAAMAWVLSRRTRDEPGALLAARFGIAEPTHGSRRAARAAAGAGAALALALALWGARANAELASKLFFGAGACMLLGAGSAAAVYLMPGARRMGVVVSFARLAHLGASRRAGRSLAAIGMLASGTFLVISVNAFRLGGEERLAAGTGGFALFARTSLPVVPDLSRPEGRSALGLARLRDVQILGLRLADGDEASCRNLARPRRPPLLGADTAAIAARNPFRFTATLTPTAAPWTLLERADDPDVVPAIADEAVAKWVLGVGLGDTLEYVDEAGRPFRVRLVAMLDGSILQGYLVIDARAFAARLPSVSGHRVFLIDAPAGHEAEAASALSDSALADRGLTITPAADRLASFDAVQNTYLSIFTAIGGLGLILGCAGLGVVVLRNVLERRGELAAMRAVGFSRQRLRRLLLVEHGLLLAWGVAAGVASAAVAIGPALAERGAVPAALLAWTLLAVIANGLLWTSVAARLALSGELLDALRHE